MSFNPKPHLYRNLGTRDHESVNPVRTTTLGFLGRSINLAYLGRIWLVLAIASLLIATGCSSDKPTRIPTQVPTATPAPQVPRAEMVDYLKAFNGVQNSLHKEASEIEGPDNETLRNDSDALYNLVSKYFELASDSVTRISELEPPAGDAKAVTHWKLSIGYYTDGRDLYDGLMLAIKADDSERIKTLLSKLQDDAIGGYIINQATEGLMGIYRIPDFEVDYRQRVDE